MEPTSYPKQHKTSHFNPIGSDEYVAATLLIAEKPSQKPLSEQFGNGHQYYSHERKPYVLSDSKTFLANIFIIIYCSIPCKLVWASSTICPLGFQKVPDR